jgi:glycine oxidase
MSQRVAIVGAGVIGLLTARLLLQRGVRVVIADCGEPARAASWAGGGIVSPLYPWRYSPAVTALAQGAQDAHRELSRALHRETGIDPQYNACGLLMLDAPEEEVAIRWCRLNRRRVICCDAAAVSALQTGLSAAGALWMPEIGNVRNPRLLQALLAFVAVHPLASCHWRAQVCLDAVDGGERLRIDGRPVAADAVCITAGAWTAPLLQRFAVNLPLVPVRGQMIQYAPQPGRLRRIVLSGGRYLIPRRDGRILAGSTLEHTGFDSSTTPLARAELHAAAVAMMPALGAAAIENHWAGLRPGAPAGIPFIDRIAGTRVFVNAGHFRNGLVLAPASAALGVALMLGETGNVDAASYRIEARRDPELQ